MRIDLQHPFIVSENDQRDIISESGLLALEKMIAKTRAFRADAKKMARLQRKIEAEDKRESERIARKF